MPSYRVRLDCTGGVLEETVKWFLNDKCDVYLLVHHQINDNPHYHAYVETKYTQGNFSNLIKKTFGISGADYSNKKCDDDRKYEYFSYLFNVKKGNVPTYVTSHGIDNLTINQAKENAKQIAKEFQEKVSSGKKTKFDIAEFVASRDCKDFGEIYDAVVDALHKNRMCSATYVVRDIISTVVHIQGGRYRQELKEQTLKFFSQDRV